MQKQILFAFIGMILLFQPVIAHGATRSTASKPVLGTIYLDVQRRGEAWYVDPVSKKRVFLANGAVAYEVMRDHGLGITNADLAKIPVGFLPVAQKTYSSPSLRESECQQYGYDSEDENETEYLLCILDQFTKVVESGEYVSYIKQEMASDGKMMDSDKDRISNVDERMFGTKPYVKDTDKDTIEDGVEIEKGFSPLGKGNMPLDQKLVNRLKGRILLQVQGKGEAWYVHPITGRRYYLPDGPGAYRIMSLLGVGTTSAFIDRIPADTESDFLYKTVNSAIESCSGVDCLVQGITNRKTTRAMIEYSYMESTVHLSATYIAGAKKDYLSFMLHDIDVDASASTAFATETLESILLLIEAEGDTTLVITDDQKERFVNNIAIMHARIVQDLPSLLPRATCVANDRAVLITQISIIDQSIKDMLALDPMSETYFYDLEALVEEVDAMPLMQEEPASCSWQGGILSM